MKFINGLILIFVFSMLYACQMSVEKKAVQKNDLASTFDEKYVCVQKEIRKILDRTKNLNEFKVVKAVVF
ncbi:MAG: hypothetical protein KAQ98_13160 [Bacteriovoracaceae bacterium]|nr:hypothetical protein [Bacteriovoracaceae bacterium]